MPLQGMASASSRNQKPRRLVNANRDLSQPPGRVRTVSVTASALYCNRYFRISSTEGKTTAEDLLRADGDHRNHHVCPNGTGGHTCQAIEKVPLNLREVDLLRRPTRFAMVQKVKTSFSGDTRDEFRTIPADLAYTVMDYGGQSRSTKPGQCCDSGPAPAKFSIPDNTRSFTTCLPGNSERTLAKIN